MTGAFTFESKFPDGSPRRHAGSWRPTLEEAETIMDELPWEATIHTMHSNEAPSFLHLNWQRGMLDRPLYHVEEWERT